MRIATYNVNGINGRLANLLDWLQDTAPDIACLQELKAPDEKFPPAAIRNAGYSAVWHGEKVWNGVAILQRGGEPALIRRGLPGDPDDTHSRYIEEEVNGLVYRMSLFAERQSGTGPENSTTSYAGSPFERPLDWNAVLIRAARGLSY